MNQIISQHGWGLDRHIWGNLKYEFKEHNWFWQDNDRGYFSDRSIKSYWLRTSKRSIRMVMKKF